MSAFRLVLTPLALACGCACAQTVIEPVVITGSTRAQRIIDAPFAISVLDAEALRDAGAMVNLSEVMSRVPGLVVNNRNNYAQDLQISSRGFGARAAFGVRGLRLYADGIPATMPDGQGQVAHLDLAGAERIEVLRGPFSALYGNSSGGVIAVFSAPVRSPQVEASLDAGSFGLRQARVGLATPLGAGFDLRGSFSAMETDGFRPQSRAKRHLGNLRLGWQQGADSVVLRLSDHTQQAQDPLGLSRAQFEADPRQTTPQALQFDTRKTIRQTQEGLQWRHSFDERSVLSEAALMVYNGSRGVTQWQAIAPATQQPPRHGGGLVDFDRSYHGAEARVGWRIGTADLITGLSAEDQVDDRQGYENFTGIGADQVLGVNGRLRRDERNRASTREVFAQSQVPLADDIALTGGVRSGRVRMRTEDHFLGNGDDSGALTYRYTNPVLGLRWTPRPGWALHASAARGFESPTLGELAYRPDNQAGFNNTLKGQTSRQFELGSKVRGQFIELDATVFVAAVDDEIGVMSNSGGRSSFRNVGRTRREGAELSLLWRASADLRLQAAASWLHATYRDAFLACSGVPCTTPSVPVAAGNRIAGTQNASAYAELAWRPRWVPGEWALEWRAIGRSPVNDSNSDFAAGYALANLRWRHTLELGSADALELLARVDNVFDRVHVGSVIVNDANGRFFEPGAPRSGLLSVRWQHRF
ncbi:TonB-dependent receptor family protein [Aquabacterium sp.]|uniref:TonB-dependent receptor family protein n=1 Tax=Aquabacterium sp. TaxID=1872578 RepID=UPI002CCE67D5|nr:TonB-dependent receptor [Aquabacterium sp.]HSW06423.1 TonB-dependent receptor [Aquabacterium sp.]